MTYLALDAAEIVGTIERLQGRIEERFPGSGLGRVCGQLLEIARNARERAVWIAKPILPLRIASAALAVVIIAGLSLMVIQLRPPPGTDPAKAAPNHSPRFYVDEGALPVGVRAMAHLAVDYLTGRQ